MNAKWFFSTFILAFAFFGVFQKQVTVPNQEVVLEFVNSASITKQTVQSAINNVKEQLQSVGATNIKVQEEKNGTLKISYYSAINVANVQQLLAKKHGLVLEQVPFEQENDGSSSSKSSYNVNVYEIKKGSDPSSLNGKHIIEIKYDSDRFTNPNVYFPLISVAINKTNHLVKTAYRVNKQVQVTIKNIPHKVPEVRAGPNC
ncbi:hypothetical protein FUA26_10465 [Seonamhaeicola algicola]|uniref:Uncharacterized protein n=1 Tax=Seonamhaeicola algicola TaxID=1719036 RepID=A0A5C7ANJ9_9FLAO|nr:hypothetical protein [Seonamhaeicola algicola]TXE09901.1 hypothetical protein FUA26_10465 [Seonamhaeicola algicola]